MDAIVAARVMVLAQSSRRDRIGIDEGIFCEGKSVAQISAILSNGLEKERSLFLTRLGEAQFEMLEDKYKTVMDYEDNYKNSCYTIYSDDR